VFIIWFITAVTTVLLFTIAYSSCTVFQPNYGLNRLLWAGLGA